MEKFPLKDGNLLLSDSPSTPSILTIIPHRTTMIPKDSFYVLLVLTVLFVVVLLPVPIWTAMRRATRLGIMPLFVITIWVLVKQGGKHFLNLV